MNKNNETQEYGKSMVVVPQKNQKKIVIHFTTVKLPLSPTQSLLKAYSKPRLWYPKIMPINSVNLKLRNNLIDKSKDFY